MRILRGAAAALVLAAGSSLSLAQEGQPERPATPPAEAPPARRVQTQLLLHGEHHFDADLEDAPGSVAIDRVGADLRVQVPIGERSQLGVTVGSEYSLYNFKNATGFATGFSEPWDDTVQSNAAVTFSSQATRQWSWFAGAGIDDSLQTGAKAADGLTGGFFGGVSYSISEHLTIGLGAAIRSRLEDDGSVAPIPVIEWQISEQWKLGTHAEIGGRGLELSYQPLEQLTLMLDATYSEREFRLNSSAASPEGVGRDYRVPISLGAQWNISRQVAVTGFVGIDAWQEYTLINSDGAKVSQVNGKPDVFVGAKVAFSF